MLAIPGRLLASGGVDQRRMLSNCRTLAKEKIPRFRCIIQAGTNITGGSRPYFDPRPRRG